MLLIYFVYIYQQLFIIFLLILHNQQQLDKYQYQQFLTYKYYNHLNDFVIENNFMQLIYNILLLNYIIHLFQIFQLFFFVFLQYLRHDYFVYLLILLFIIILHILKIYKIYNLHAVLIRSFIFAA